MVKNERVCFPDAAGLMVLPWSTLFPGGLLPLRIFEERYRQMLRDALDSHRMFAIAHIADSLGETDFEWEPLGTLGVLRACVTNDDGTANLILQGVARVEFTNNNPEPYPHADIEILRDSAETSPKVRKLHAKILSLVQKPSDDRPDLPPGFLDHLATIESPASLGDLVASTVITNPVHRRDLLAERNVPCRLELLVDYLQNYDHIDPEIRDGNLENLEAGADED